MSDDCGTKKHPVWLGQPRDTSQKRWECELGKESGMAASESGKGAKNNET